MDITGGDEGSFSPEDTSFSDYNPWGGYDLGSLFDNYDPTDNSPVETGDEQGGYGTGYGPSSGVYGNPAHPNTTGAQQAWTSLQDLFSNGKARSLGIGVLSLVNPALGAMAAKANAAYGVGQGLITGDYTGAARSGLGFAGLSPAGTMIANAGLDVASNKNPMGSIAAGFGGQLGNQLGIPGAGGIMAGIARSGVNQNENNSMMNSGLMPGESGGMPNNGGWGGGGSGGGVNWESILPGLAQLYSSASANNDERAATSLAGSTGQLSSMFSPDSAYAQTLRQQLDRRDAAAGRRSQYGPREVELQSALAKMFADNAAGIMKANTDAAGVRLKGAQEAYARRNQMINSILGVGKQNNWFGLGGGSGGTTPYENSGGFSGTYNTENRGWIPPISTSSDSSTDEDPYYVYGSQGE